MVNQVSKQDFVTKAKLIFGDVYDYSEFEYTKSSIKSVIICPIHGKFYKSPNKHISSMQSCASCNNHHFITNEYIDNFLLQYNKQIQRIDNCVTSNVKIKWKCLIDTCCYEWQTTPAKIIHRGDSCPQCSHRLPLSNQVIDNRLKDKLIKRLGDFINVTTPTLFRCLNCQNEWEAEPRRIIHQNCGCPECSTLKPWTNNEFDDLLIDRNIKRLGSYVNSKKPIEFECQIQGCAHKWFACPSSILSGSGCPKCNRPGQNEKTVLKFLEESGMPFQWQVKITNFDPKETHRYKVDFYLTALNLIIEYNGIQHYQPTGFSSNIDAAKAFKSQQVRDNYVRCFCKYNNINLLEIDGRKYKGKKLEKFLVEYFSLQEENYVRG